jgi:hypothetical protein
MRHIRSRPTRSGLIVAGVAVAVAFFVLFAAMSAGLNSFIDEELDRPRTTHIYLDTGSPTPFSPDQVGLIELVTSTSQARFGSPHWVTPRAMFLVDTATAGTVRLWGTSLQVEGQVASPPYDTSADLEWGRHLRYDDQTNGTGYPNVVLGYRAQQALFRGVEVPQMISVGPSGTVDPWWLPSATAYPLEGRTSVAVEPRGPVSCYVVGVMAPGQGDDLDWGIFASLDPLMTALGQHDQGRDKTYYPQVVITIEDASRVDVVDLEETLVETIPGIQGTDDHWDPDEFSASYGGAVTALDGWLMIVTAVLVVMLVAGVSDTTLVAVTDRRREIATLRALGVGRRQVSRLVLTEVTILVAAGLLLGLVIGSALAYLFGYLHDTTGGSGAFLAPTSLDPLVLVAAAALALGSAALAAAYPASRAAGQPPTEALRYE